MKISDAKKTDLRRRAEASLPQRPRQTAAESAGDTARLLHELQVHQIELEMQNAELQAWRYQAETLLEKYIDLYDFAPVGYFSLNQKGRILRCNLTGATLLGVERSRLASRSLPRFAVTSGRGVITDLIDRVFAGDGNQSGDTQLKKDDGTTFWAGLHANLVFAEDLGENVCRMVISDITSSKQAEEARRQAEVLALSNAELQREIVRRQAVEDALKDSERHQHSLLEQARHLQEELRAMSRSSLQAREDDHRRISRDLHDDVAQTLVGINVHLETLARMSEIPPKVLKRHIVQTQKRVEKSVKAVLLFSLELRPPALEDLGLNTSLKTLLKAFMKRTGIRVHFRTFAGADLLGSDQQTALYRITQTALSNVAEHAQASHVELRISRTAEAVCLAVADNGKAFDVQQMAGLQAGQHLGLISMRERAEMMGGTFQIASEEGKGTSLRVQLPV
jgi:PAS domain S-box-containing protein